MARYNQLRALAFKYRGGTDNHSISQHPPSYTSFTGSVPEKLETKTLVASSTYNWRPKVMRAPYLVSIAALSLILAMVQECLCQKSNRHGSLFEFEHLRDISIVQYFTWRYMPPCIVVIYGIVVATLDHEVMRFAPYHRLARPEGLEAADHIIREPASYFWYLSHPSKAGSLIWVSALQLIAAAVIVPLAQNASLVSKHKDGQNFVVSIDAGWSRFLSITLLMVAGCNAALWVILRKSTQLKESPYGIAGVVSVFRHECFSDLTAGLSVLSSEKRITHQFKGETFVLRQGVVVRRARSLHPKASTAAKKSQPKPEHLTSCRPSVWLTISAWSAGLGLSGFYAISSFTTIHNMVLYTLPWLGTALAVLNKLAWAQYEVSLRGIEPFNRLRRGQAPPKCLFDDYSGSPILVMAIQAYKRGNRLLALQGLCSVLLEVWVIAVTSLCDRTILTVAGEGGVREDITDSEKTSADFYIAAVISFTVPLITGVSAIVVAARTRWSFLPKNPRTIANLLLYTQNTTLRTSLEDLRELNPVARERRLCELGKKYALGWFGNDDNAPSVHIDEEPSFAPYKFFWKDENDISYFIDHRQVDESGEPCVTACEWGP